MPILRQIAQLGHPVLRTLAAPVERPTSVDVRALIDDMLATLREADGVGIAAPQVYEPVTLFIVASRPNPRYPEAPMMEPEVVINPEILERSEDMVKGWEGCRASPESAARFPAIAASGPATRPSEASRSNASSQTSSPESSNTRRITSVASCSSTGSRARETSSPRGNTRSCSKEGNDTYLERARLVSFESSR